MTQTPHSAIGGDNPPSRFQIETQAEIDMVFNDVIAAYLTAPSFGKAGPRAEGYQQEWDFSIPVVPNVPVLLFESGEVVRTTEADLAKVEASGKGRRANDADIKRFRGERDKCLSKRPGIQNKAG